MTVHLDRRHMAMLEQLDEILWGRHLLPLLFPERPYVIPFMLDQFFHIAFSYCCKTRLHCRHTFRYTPWHTTAWPLCCALPRRGYACIPYIYSGCVPNVRLVKSTRKDQRCAIGAGRSCTALPLGPCRLGSGTTQKSWLCIGICVMIV